ncbi:MAG: two-component sensor histidine kinase, partial [Ignavibacteria bacterium]
LRFLSISFFPVLMFAGASLIFYLLFFPFDISHFLFITVIIFFAYLTTSHFYYYNRKNEINNILLSIEKIISGELAEINETNWEVTDRKIIERLNNFISIVKDQEQKLLQASKARSQFLGNVSHELRTPIFTIQGYIESLLNGAINDEKVNMRFLEKAAKHLNNLNQLLNDLIEISMIEAGEMMMSFRYFDLNSFMSEIENDFKSFAEEKGKKLIIKYVDKSVEVLGDKARLKNVISNLISNAVKYNPNDLIEIICEEFENKVKISVKDNGLGIPEEEIGRIFERFYRTKRDRNSQIPGTGLGLAIAKHIIEAHGSKLSVDSKKNIGTQFSFELTK